MPGGDGAKAGAPAWDSSQGHTSSGRAGAELLAPAALDCGTRCVFCPRAPYQQSGKRTVARATSPTGLRPLTRMPAPHSHSRERREVAKLRFAKSLAGARQSHTPNCTKRQAFDTRRNSSQAVADLQCVAHRRRTTAPFPLASAACATLKPSWIVADLPHT